MSETADVVVSNASAGVATQALVADKPQLLVPFDVEKDAISKRVALTKTALVVGRDSNPTEAGNVLDIVLRESTHHANARAIASSLEPAEWQVALERLVSAG